MNLLEALPTVIGTAAIAPALFMLWLVIAAEERPGPPAQVWTAFLLGAASVSLLRLIHAPLVIAASENPWIAPAMHSIFGAALPEEGVKVAAIVLVSTRRRAFADPMETVVYGAAVGLGFAAHENLAYLVQNAEMWQSLAALRAVLTVPFHGALSIIAGAYLAIARSGTALGAHRQHRDWARLSNRLLMLIVPLVLHAAFDFPLLMLQQDHYLDPTLRMWLSATSLLIGFGSIGFAIRLVRRVARHHAPRTEIGRERLHQLRRMWALLVTGGGTGFVGLAFVLTWIHLRLDDPEHDVAEVLVPVGFALILLGIALLSVTIAVYILGRNRMHASAKVFSSATNDG